jgi:hypothetical protein
MQALVRVLTSAGAEHQFPVFTSMLRHASSKALSAAACAAVVDMAGQLVRGIPGGGGGGGQQQQRQRQQQQQQQFKGAGAAL